MTGVPTTLEETVPALDALLCEEDRKAFQESEDPDDAIISVHHSLGQYLRNTWGLWKDSALAEHLKEVHGISHPDDMSHFILQNYSRVRYPSVWDRL